MEHYANVLKFTNDPIKFVQYIRTNKKYFPKFTEDVLEKILTEHEQFKTQKSSST